MKKLRVFVLLLLLGSSASNAQVIDQVRTLFASGKWHEVLEIASVNANLDVQVMRLESLLRLGEFVRAQELAKVVLPQLIKNRRSKMLLHLMRGAAQYDDPNAFFEYDSLYDSKNGEKSNEVAYWRGRMHFLAGRFEAATPQLLRVPLYSLYGIRAQFLLATCEMKLGQREFALNRFAKLKSVQAFNQTDAKITGMASLAHAKLLFAANRYEESLVAYRELELEPRTRVELAWTAMKLGDGLLASKPFLAAAEYDSASRVVQIDTPESFKREFILKRQLLDAELKLRLGDHRESRAVFESVIKDADRLLALMPAKSWLNSQSEISAVDRLIVEADQAAADLQETLQKNQKQKPKKEQVELKETQNRLETLRSELQQVRDDTILKLRPRWKAYIELFRDSARVGLFANRFSKSARTENQILSLEKAKASALRDVDRTLALEEDGVQK